MTATIEPNTDAADAAWSAVPVDSTTRECCGGIGTHTAECNPIRPGTILIDTALANINGPDTIRYKVLRLISTEQARVEWRAGDIRYTDTIRLSEFSPTEEWRDYTPDLTAEQIAELERLETVHQWTAGKLTWQAREDARTNHLTATVPLPEGAISADKWDYEEDGKRRRNINFPRHTIPTAQDGTLSLDVSAFQSEDGTLNDVGLWVGEPGGGEWFLTLDQVPALLTAVAANLEVLNRLTT